MAYEPQFIADFDSSDRAQFVKDFGIEITYQFSRPSADYNDGNWLNELGTQTNLYESINEVTASDSDYIYTLATGFPTIIKLSSISDPLTSDYHAVKYRAKGAGSYDLKVTLLQISGGETTIAYWTETDVGTSYTDFEHTLSGAEADTITDYTNLYLKFEAL